MPNVSTGGGSAQPPESEGGRLLAQRYRLLTEVGHGGMGTVWHAHDEILGRDVAVKEVILPYGLSQEEREIHHKRTFREARTAARLGHPSVVTVFDVVEEDDRPWIIMELIRARSLDKVIKDAGRLPPRRAAEIARQMLGALHTAHEAGVLHRDVKPSNVLVASGDRVVLTDFGIATSAGDVTLTQTGLVMGSPAYIAPERARGRRAGPASDLWSLGITLYAMVEGGTSPYERSEPMASLVAVISEDPEPSAHAGALRPVIDGLLRKDPDERMSALEAADLLDQVVRGEPPARRQTLPMTAVSDGGPGEEVIDPPTSTPVTEARPSSAPSADAQPTSVQPTPAPAASAPAADPEPTTAEPAVRPAAAETSAPGDDTADDDRGLAGLGLQPGGNAAATTGAGTRQPETSPNDPVRRSGAVRTALVIAAIAVTALLVLGIWAWISRDDDNNKSSGSARSHQSASTPASPTTARSTPSGIPAGFRLHKDPTGFAIAVPTGWSGPEHKSTSVFFYAPDRRSYIQIDQTDQPNASALADWQRSDKSAPGRFSNYHRLRLEPTGDQQPVADTGDGSKSADWEFTWGSGSGKKHVLNRGFVTHGHGYAILISAPDSDWSATIAKLRPVFTSFQPAGS
ncbi:MAG TPA: protein kinase [Streptosporangiaceae bacterium]|jgi:serine/threonine protein kinase